MAPISLDPIPDLPISKIPPAEREATRTLLLSLVALNNYIRDLQAALSLLDHATAGVTTTARVISSESAEEALRFSNWQNIACRDGALTLFHFRDTVRGIRAELRNCRTIGALVDHRELRHAIKMFDARFPDIENLRHAISHSGNMWATLAARLRNMVKGDFASGSIKVSGKFALTSMLNGRQFTMTWEGGLLSYELSDQTVEKLIAVTNQVYLAFRGAEKDAAEPASKTSNN